MYLEPDKYYHIYNHANGFENVFRCKENYLFFLQKYLFHLLPFFDTYAYCLMPNHFHLLIRVKSREEMLESMEKILNSPTYPTLPKFQTSAKFQDKLDVKDLPDFFRLEKIAPSSRIKTYSKFLRKYNQLSNIPPADHATSTLFIGQLISRQLGDLFSSYTQAFNKQFKRMGGIFIKNFERKEVDSPDYLLNLVNYINNNPVYHGFVNKAEEWPYSSYIDILNNNSNIVDCKTVVGWFNDLQNFIDCHNKNPDIDFGYSFE
ncbi:hypothetical protein DSECCO2_416110 [anaerobic digester metagenome]